MSRQPATKGGRSSRPHAMLLGWLQRLPLDGQFGLADARAILIKVDAMRAKARGLGQGLELLLAVAVDPVIPASILAGTLFDLSAEHPSVGVALTTLPMRSALHALVNRQFTLAITTERQRDRLVEAECLGLVQPFVAVCADHHPLAAVPAAGWSAVELSDHLQIVVSDPSPMSDGLGFGVLPPGTWRVSDLASKLALIQAGVGWGNLPQWMVDADLAHGTLVRVAATALGTQSETALPPTCSGASTNRQTPPCAAFASGCLCVSPKVDSCAADSVEAASQIAAH